MRCGGCSERGRSGGSGITSASDGLPITACVSTTSCSRPKMSERLVDGGVDRWLRGEENASDHAPAWILLDL
jgi:hypothetical protein